MKKFLAKQFILTVRLGLLAAFVLSAASCPKEITEKAYLDQKGPYFLPPLASVVAHETFDTRTEGPLSISDSGSSLDGVNGIFRTTTAVPADAVFSIVDEKHGKSLKIENRGTAGGGVSTEFLFVPSQNAFDHLQGKQALLQCRMRLENTNNVYIVGPYVHHARYPAGGAPGGNQSVQSRLYGAGQFQFNNNASGADVWEATATGQNEWHLIEILFDFTDNRYKGYVNGEQVIDELFRNISSPGFGTVRFYINSYNTTAYLDDIRITTDSATGPFEPPATHFVTFNKNHSDPSSTGWTEANPQIVPVTTPHETTVAALPEPPRRAGHAFVGWNTMQGGNGEDFTASTPVTDSITVYAQWQPAYTVTFDKNHNDSSGWTDAVPQRKLVIIGQATTVDALPLPPARTGHGFIGWNTMPGGNGTAFTASATVTADITVYAQWESGRYTVTFDKNHDDASGWTDAVPSFISVNQGQTAGALPAAPTRARYKFTGWMMQNSEPFTTATVVNADMLVLAQWERDVTVLAQENFESFANNHSFNNNDPVGSFANGSTFRVVIPAKDPAGATTSVTVVDEDGNKVLKIFNNNTNTGGTSAARFDYEPTGAIITDTTGKKAYISFKVKHDGRGTACVPYVYATANGSGNATITNQLLNNGYRLYDGSGYVVVNPAPINQWHSVDIALDYAQKTYQISIDGVVIRYSIPPGNPVTENFPFRAPELSSLGRIRFYIEGNATAANHGTFFLDDVRIWYED